MKALSFLGFDMKVLNNAISWVYTLLALLTAHWLIYNFTIYHFKMYSYSITCTCGVCNSCQVNQVIVFRVQHSNRLYTTIHIKEAISLDLVRALLEYRSQRRHTTTKHNFSEPFSMYKTNRFHFSVRVYCNRSRKML